MKQTFTLKEKCRQFILMLIPILVTQLGLFSMNFFDTTMSGHYSPSHMAGVAIGSSIWVPVFTGLSGILMAITPITAHLIGGKRHSEVSFSVVQGLYLSFIMAAVVFLAGLLSLNTILDHMKLENEVRSVAFDFLWALSFGLLPLFAYNVLRSFIDALGMTKISMIITLSALPINLILNYLLIFGKAGFPELGGVGAGFASAITYWFICLFAILIIIRQQPFREYNIFKTVFAVSFLKWKEILKIGVPIGFAIFFETSIFASVTLFMSNYDTDTIASHQAALNFASFLYMLPLSISMALTILVGFEAGAQRPRDAKQYSWLGVAAAIILAIICGIVLLYFRTEIAGLYTKDKAVLELTSHFLLFALFFQLSDAIQAPVQGALRGYKDVNITFLMTLLSYWVIGLPTGYLIASHTSLGAFGYWVGLIAGLAVGAVTLSARLLIIQKRNNQPL